MNVNSWMVFKSKHLLPKKSANEKLGVATELWPGSLWGAFHLWSGVALYTGGLYIAAVGLDILKFEQALL